jgi:hypothetical protein
MHVFSVLAKDVSEIQSMRRLIPDAAGAFSMTAAPAPSESM